MLVGAKVKIEDPNLLQNILMKNSPDSVMRNQAAKREIKKEKSSLINSNLLEKCGKAGNVKTSERPPPPKKVCASENESSTTPFLLMQKMLKGETDLILPTGIVIFINYCIYPSQVFCFCRDQSFRFRFQGAYLVYFFQFFQFSYQT